MDERPEPQRIEIELTSNESDRRGATATRADGSDDAVVAGGIKPGWGWWSTERGRLIVATACAGILALLAGVLIGRSGSGGGGSAEEATVTTLGSTTPTPTSPAVVVETLPPPAAPSTTASRQRGRRPTTTVVENPEPRVGQMTLAPVVGELAAEVVAVTNRGELLRIDTASGSTIGLDVQGAQFGAPVVHAGVGWILLPSFDGSSSSVVYHDDGTTSTLDVGTAFPILMAARSDRFWRMEERRSDGDGPRVVEQSVLTGPTGVELPVPGFPQLVDPLGGVVVEAPGGSYLVNEAGTIRLTDGHVVALGATRALAHECDPQLVCGFTVIDRTTGESRPLALDATFGDRTALDAGRWVFPDPWNAAEDAVLVNAWDESGSRPSRSGVLDLTTGTFTEIAVSADFATMQWSPEGSHVFWLDRGILKVFDRDTAESVEFAEGLGQIIAFAIRPVAIERAAAEPVSTTEPVE